MVGVGNRRSLSTAVGGPKDRRGFRAGPSRCDRSPDRWPSSRPLRRSHRDGSARVHRRLAPHGRGDLRAVHGSWPPEAPAQPPTRDRRTRPGHLDRNPCSGRAHHSPVPADRRRRTRPGHPARPADHREVTHGQLAVPPPGPPAPGTGPASVRRARTYRNARFLRRAARSSAAAAATSSAAGTSTTPARARYTRVNRSSAVTPPARPAANTSAVRPRRTRPPGAPAGTAQSHGPWPESVRTDRRGDDEGRLHDVRSSSMVTAPAPSACGRRQRHRHRRVMLRPACLSPWWRRPGPARPPRSPSR